MTAAELLAQLDAAGVPVVLVAEANELELRPSTLIPPGLRQEIIAQKAELTALVAARSKWVSPAPLPGGAVPLTDPRGDLGGSEQWDWLLAMAALTVSDALAGVLHGFRCCGCLLKFERGAWLLRPLIDESERLSLWHTREAWERDREAWLMPFKTELTELLARLPAPTSPAIQPESTSANLKENSP